MTAPQTTIDELCLMLDAIRHEAPAVAHRLELRWLHDDEAAVAAIVREYERRCEDVAPPSP